MDWTSRKGKVPLSKGRTKWTPALCKYAINNGDVQVWMEVKEQTGEKGTWEDDGTPIYIGAVRFCL